jgi:SAM-dependent methyltransferase
LIETATTAIGVPSELGSWDMSIPAFGNNPRILRRENARDLKRTVDDIQHPERKPPRVVQPELKLQAFCGYNIYHYDSRYFAVPQDQNGFDIHTFRSRPISQTSVGHTIQDVQEEILRNERRVQSATSRALFLWHAQLDGFQEYLAPFLSNELTVLSVGKREIPDGAYSVVYYIDADGKPADRIDINNISAGLLKRLRDQNFDVVVIPHERRSFWQGIHLEQFASTIATCIINVFPNNHSRTYRGEDVHRIQYNKAYLNSMFRYVPSIRRQNILEVGCSDGLACDLLLCEEPQQITGVDVMAIVGCGYRDPRIRYERVDGSLLPFEDNSFDLCYSIATLEHCVDPIKVIEEMHRVTVPGGYCYIQAGPLYFSPFGHHMFGYFDDFPWVHLRLSPDEIIERLERTGLSSKIQNGFGKDAETYVHSMMSIDHINGRRIAEYGLEYFEKHPGIDLVASNRSYEGEDLLTDSIRKELGYMSRKDLVSHGFELIFKKKA